MSDLPTIAFTTGGGETRRVRFERDEADPSHVVRIEEERIADGWRLVGSEDLSELVIDGEHQMPRSLFAGSEPSRRANTLRDGESSDATGGTRPVPPGVASPTEEVFDDE